MEITAVQVMLANKPAIILAFQMSLTRKLIASDLSACLGGGLSGIMAGDLNANIWSGILG
jgi:hypothetical protein